MKENYLNKFVNNLDGSFDTEEPNKGHRLRFEQKLISQTVKSPRKSILRQYLKPLLATAAVLIIGLSLFIGGQRTEESGMDLSKVSTELSETQDFFTLAINEELKKIEAERSPLTENLIYDGLRQLNHLEEGYQKLKIDLEVSGKNQLVIYAMITNFQKRIDVLTNLLEQIENLKQLKTKNNETNITI